jgi:F-type H+-transporting ATPase subunit epsilon
MKLRVTTPTAIVVDTPDVRHVRAEDVTGAFGVQPGHAEFVTALTVSVLTYRTGDGVEHHVAVGGGVLRVSAGELVEVAAREAVASQDLDTLRGAILSELHRRADDEAKARTRAAQLNVSLVRNLRRFIRAERDGTRGALRARLDAGERP